MSLSGKGKDERGGPVGAYHKIAKSATAVGPAGDVTLFGGSAGVPGRHSRELGLQPVVATGTSRAERRQLTVMFCDLVGSMALTARLDPEDAREILWAYQSACARAVASYEGYVAQYLGDGLLAYFGYPQAHEDDAERAARAGLDIVAAVALLGGPAKIEVRIGIATGLVVVGDVLSQFGAEHRPVIGGTPNLAARLQGVAAPGSIVVSETTRDLLGCMFDLRALGPQKLKGLDSTVQVFALEGLRAVESRFEARGVRVACMVGREAESEQLVTRRESAWRGRGHVVLVSGEAGIGKSRLIAWLMENAGAEPHILLRYQCTPHHKDRSLHPFVVQVEHAAGFQPGEPSRVRAAKLEGWLRLTGFDPAAAFPYFATLVGISPLEPCGPSSPAPAEQRRSTMEVLLQQVEALAGTKRLLMIFEDAQWADADSLELLERMARLVGRLPIMLAVTGRPEFCPGWAAQENAPTLYLRRLHKFHAKALVENVARGARLPTAVLDQILSKADGVPLYAEELTRSALNWSMEREERRGILPGSFPAQTIPPTLHGALMARLDESSQAKEIAQIGAVIGREFSFLLLLAASRMEGALMETALVKLEASEIATRHGAPPDAIYTFRHVLLRDAAYESLLKSRRRQFHKRIAKALRDYFPAIAQTTPELVAFHFTLAGRNEQAVDWWRRAATPHSG